jgi:hypothetical protein
MGLNELIYNSYSQEEHNQGYIINIDDDTPTILLLLFCIIVIIFNIVIN